MMRGQWLALLWCSAAFGAEAQDFAFGKRMEYGPATCHTVTFALPPNNNADRWDGAVTRALVVALGPNGSAGATSVCYDLNRLAFCATWPGGLDRSKTHHTSYKGSLPPRPAAKPDYLDLAAPGWLVDDQPLADPLGAWRGHALHGTQVVLRSRIGDRYVLESPQPAGAAVRRIIRVGPGKTRVALLAGAVAPESAGRVRVSSSGREVVASGGEFSFRAALSPGSSLAKFRAEQGRVYVAFPAAEQEIAVAVTFAARAGNEPPDELKAELAPLPDLAAWTRGGPRRWPQTFVTNVVRGADKAAYVTDELTVPEFPYGSWMRFSALDAFDDGRFAVATLSGDVWLVTLDRPGPGQVEWSRFATGLYEPLGLKVVDGHVLVRGRDRITRLVDANGDGEADVYENFHCQGEVGPSYHAFLFDLVRDREGHLYYTISGRKSPTLGQVVKVSPDGQRWERIAAHFRHANGLGFGGPHGWLTVADNPDGKFPSGGSIVRPGRGYGEEGGPRTEPFLYLVPPSLDSSSGSQCWTDPQRWGPLGGCLIHTSFSHSKLTYVLTQTTGTLPNGFAVGLPLTFSSGVMRAVVNPRDGQLYVAGLRGWDTNAAQDGCLTRVRATGLPAHAVTAAAVTAEGIRLTFSEPLAADSVDFDNFAAERVGKGRAEVDIVDVRRIDDRTVLVEFDREDLLAGGVIDRERTKKDPSGTTHYRVIDPLAIEFNLRGRDGSKVRDTIYCTINALP